MSGRVATAGTAVAAGLLLAVPAPGATVSDAPVAPAAAAAAPRVELMVVGRARVLRAPVRVLARARSVAVGRRRCAVAAGTPVAALAALRVPKFTLRDYGACSARSPRASEMLYVARIGRDRGRGANGWVYKVGRRAPGVGAASPRARVRAGARVLWFYCRMGRDGCQRTLEVRGPARAAPGAPVTFTVRAYDDRGRGIAAAGARVRFGGATAVTAPDGTATMAAPATAGRHRAAAQATGLVPSFPAQVRVG